MGDLISGTYEVSFKDDPFLFGMYKDVVEKKGAVPKEMDVGWEVMDFNKPGQINRSVPNKSGDGLIEPEELAGYLANDPKKYHEELEKIIGNKVPWTLDDFDDSTNFDADIIQRVHGAGSELDRILSENGVKIGSEKFHIAKAWGMLIFSICPEFSKIEKDPRVMDFMRQKLKKMQIAGFEEYLKNNEGLGLYKFDYLGPTVGEIPAYEALKQKKGNCTEKANILYAVFKEVDLPAYLLEVDHINSAIEDNKVFEAWFVVPPENPAMGHAAVGLAVGGKLLYFDATAYFLDDTIPRYHFPLPAKDLPRVAAMLYLVTDSNISFNFNSIERDDKVLRLLSKLENLRKFGRDSLAFSVDDTIGVIKVGLGDCVSARKYLEEAMNINPLYINTQKNVIVLKKFCDQDEKAFLTELGALYYKYPFFVTIRDMYIGYLFQQRQIAKATEELEEGLKKYPRYGQMYVELIEMYLNLEKYEEALKLSKKRIKSEPGDLTLYYHAAIASWLKGDAAGAWKFVKALYEKKALFFEQAEDITSVSVDQMRSVALNLPSDMQIEMPDDIKMAQYAFLVALGCKALASGLAIEALKAFSYVDRNEFQDPMLYECLFKAYKQVGNENMAERIAEEYKRVTGKKLREQ